VTVRIFMGGFATETNTSSPIPTGIKSFTDEVFRRRDASLDPTAPWTAPQRAWRRMAEADGWEVVESISAFAQPAGPTTRAAWEAMRTMLIEDLRAAMPVDGVLLFMHGAMVAEGCDDCEGATLAAVREVVGPDVPVGLELDLHCHLTAEMMRHATAIVTYKEYPHTDLAPRAEELFGIIAAAMRGEVRPAMASADARMVGIWRTSLPPVRRFIDRMQALEGRDGILSVSFAHGFPWGDVPDVGARMLVVSDGDAAKAQALADTLAGELWAMRHDAATEYLSVDEALERAAASDGLSVLADVADNAGGGAPSDSSFLLEAILERGLEGFVFGYVWDPLSVRLCQEAGEGAVFDLRLCGKLGPASGRPLDLTVRVERLAQDHSQTGLGGTPAPLGDSAWVSCRGVDIVLTAVRSQPYAPDGFERLGIDLAARRGIVLKSMQHFHAAFEPVAARILYVTTPGAIAPDFATLELAKRTVPWWPRVADPFA
jgi:microcystin degradation protein MlrC